jgi:N-formylmaleamate deformylase
MSNLEELSAWYSGICRVNGIDIHYHRSGGDKPPLVALHGLMGSGACLLPLARALADFDVILPDARGHGRSSAPSNGYLYSDLAGDVVGFIEALALNAPTLAGHSMGGLTAAVVARQLGSAVRAVALIDPTFISPQWQREVYASDVAVEHRQSLKSAKDDLIAQARQRNEGRTAEVIEYLVDARLHTSPDAFEVLTPPNPDWRQVVQDIRAPMLLLVGSRGVVSVDIASELQRLNPLLRYELIPDAGHGMPYDKPERVGSAVSAFAAGIAAIELPLSPPDDRNVGFWP